MSRITVQTRVRRPRGVCLGPFRLLWAMPIPKMPGGLGFGRIATTDTPSNPAPGQTHTLDGNGWVLAIGRHGYAVLRCRSVPVRKQSA